MNLERKQSKIKILFTVERYKIWIALLYFLFVSQVLITIGTIILSNYVLTHLDTVDKELQDPAIYWFPYIIYIPLTLFTLPLLLFVIYNLKLNNIKKYSYLNESKKIIHKISKKVNWKRELNTYQRLIRKVTLVLLFSFSAVFYLVGAAAPSLYISPMNSFYQPFLLSFLMLWIAMGVKKENKKTILWLSLMLIFAMALFTIGIVVGEDFILLPFILGYQALALILMLINYFLLWKER